jgi:hypothetical protein
MLPTFSFITVIIQHFGKFVKQIRCGKYSKGTK